MIKIEDLRFTSSSIDDGFQISSKSRVASTATRIRVASLSDLSGFMRIAEDKLVRISQQDFWQLSTDEEGNTVIVRLVSDDSPIRG
jgi:hypothetical protein